ncbi:MAG: hypothetical protein WKG03_18750, partial [Telluria sp.]
VLVAELSAALAAITGASGAPSFSVDEARVARALFVVEGGLRPFPPCSERMMIGWKSAQRAFHQAPPRPPIALPPSFSYKMAPSNPFPNRGKP